MIAATFVAYLYLMAMAPAPATSPVLDLPALKRLKVDAVSLRVGDFPTPPVRPPSVARVALEVAPGALVDWLVTEVGIHVYGLRERNPLRGAQGTFGRGLFSAAYVGLGVYSIRVLYRHGHVLAARIARVWLIASKVVVVILNVRTIAREGHRRGVSAGGAL